MEAGFTIDALDEGSSDASLQSGCRSGDNRSWDDTGTFRYEVWERLGWVDPQNQLRG